MEVGLEENADKTNYMLMSHYQNAGQNHEIKIANRPSENVAKFIHLGMRKANQNLIQEEIKMRLHSVMLATIRSKPFCLLVCCLKT
jgi:hypothetical protein